MPDICGYWDRRADDEDYNENTRLIEPGRHRRLIRERKKEQKRLQHTLNERVQKACSKTGLKPLLEDYVIINDHDGFGRKRVSIYTKNQKDGSAEISIASIKANGEIVIRYELPELKSEFGLDGPIDYSDSSEEQNLAAFDFTKLLRDRNIPFKEEPSSGKMIKALDDLIIKYEKEYVAVKNFKEKYLGLHK